MLCIMILFHIVPCNMSIFNSAYSSFRSRKADGLNASQQKSFARYSAVAGFSTSDKDTMKLIIEPCSSLFVQLYKLIQNMHLHHKHKIIFSQPQEINPQAPTLHIKSLPRSRTLLCQLNQPNYLSSFHAASRQGALSRKSPSELAVVLRPGGGFDGGVGFLDGGAVLDGC